MKYEINKRSSIDDGKITNYVETIEYNVEGKEITLITSSTDKESFISFNCEEDIIKIINTLYCKGEVSINRILHYSVILYYRHVLEIANSLQMTESIEEEMEEEMDKFIKEFKHKMYKKEDLYNSSKYGNSFRYGIPDIK